mgnify:FL=1
MNKKTLILIVVIFLMFIIGIILGYSIANNKKNDAVNLKELIDDINSIKDNGEIINAKEREPYSIPSTYYGNGYSITVSLDRDSTDYFIYSNNKEIWHYTKKVKS